MVDAPFRVIRKRIRRLVGGRVHRPRHVKKAAQGKSPFIDNRPIICHTLFGYWFSVEKNYQSMKQPSIDLIDINAKVALAFGVALIAAILTYIAFFK